MIIILEGIDCSGKSTLAKKLSERTGFEIVQGSSFEISQLGADGMFEHLVNLLENDDIIMDRTFYSNLVYGELFDYPMMTSEQYDILVETIDKNALVVYLYASSGVIKYRMKNRGDDMIRINDVDNILEKYNEVLYGDFRPKMMLSIDTDNTSSTETEKMIHTLLNSLQN